MPILLFHLSNTEILRMLCHDKITDTILKCQTVNYRPRFDTVPEINFKPGTKKKCEHLEMKSSFDLR